MAQDLDYAHPRQIHHGGVNPGLDIEWHHGDALPFQDGIRIKLHAEYIPQQRFSLGLNAPEQQIPDPMSQAQAPLFEPGEWPPLRTWGIAFRRVGQ